jgi:hypothetical protein
MRKSRTYGSVRGTPGNRRSYRDPITPITTPGRDRSNELRIEAISRNWEASRAPDCKSMLCRGMQSYSVQHKEMGQGLRGPEKAVARLHIVSLGSSGAIRRD